MPGFCIRQFQESLRGCAVVFTWSTDLQFLSSMAVWFSVPWSELETPCSRRFLFSIRIQANKSAKSPLLLRDDRPISLMSTRRIRYDWCIRKSKQANKQTKNPPHILWDLQEGDYNHPAVLGHVWLILLWTVQWSWGMSIQQFCTPHSVENSLVT